MNYKYKISIITATYNVAQVLPKLITSLKAQTDQEFEWVVADGASTDNTLALLEDAQKSFNLIVDSRPDFGIYDALNRAIQLAKGEYYLVLGADDELYSDAIANFKAYTQSNIDMILSSVDVENNLKIIPKIYKKNNKVYKINAAHAVGMLLKKELHQRVGYYSHKYPIAADTLFIKKCVQADCNVGIANFTSGMFYKSGVSSQDYLGALSESFRVSLELGENKALHLFLYILKLLKNFRKL